MTFAVCVILMITTIPNNHDHYTTEKLMISQDWHLSLSLSLSLSLAAEAQPGGKQSRLFLALFDLSLTVINKQTNKQTNNKQILSKV